MPQDRAPRLRPVLIALTAFGDATPPDLREELLSGLIVLAHHPKLVSGQSGIWIDLLQHAAIDPNALIQKRLPDLLALIWANASTAPMVCLQFFLITLASTLLHFSAMKERPLRPSRLPGRHDARVRRTHGRRSGPLRAAPGRPLGQPPRVHRPDRVRHMVDPGGHALRRWLVPLPVLA